MEVMYLLTDIPVAGGMFAAWCPVLFGSRRNAGIRQCAREL
jgi:hypothetical protein